MVARKCDRCSRFYENYKNGRNITVAVKTEENVRRTKTKDLCPICEKSLDKWLNDEKIEFDTGIVQGKWLEDGRCSVCRLYHKKDTEHMSFCPNCGANNS